MSNVDQDSPLHAPASPLDLFMTFTRLALQGFGGVLAVAQVELVERKRWLSREQFMELFAVGQVLPGANVVNLALMVGDRYFGLRGALASLAGMLVVPLVVVLALTALYVEFARLPMVSGALRGMGAASAGLIIATAIKLMGTLRSGPMGLARGLCFTALTFVAMAVFRWPLIWVLAGLGTVAIAVAWQRLRGSE